MGLLVAFDLSSLYKERPFSSQFYKSDLVVDDLAPLLLSDAFAGEFSLQLSRRGFAGERAPVSCRFSGLTRRFFEGYGL